MMLNCYSIFDRKSLAYHPPYYAPTDGAAVRTLADAVADSNNMLSRHPNDYVLFCVGTFDDSRGAMAPSSPLRHVIDAIALVRAIQSEIPFPDHTTTANPGGLEEAHAAKTAANGKVVGQWGREPGQEG